MKLTLSAIAKQLALGDSIIIFYSYFQFSIFNCNLKSGIEIEIEANIEMELGGALKVLVLQTAAGILET